MDIRNKLLTGMTVKQRCELLHLLHNQRSIIDQLVQQIGFSETEREYFEISETISPNKQEINWNQSKDQLISFDLSSEAIAMLERLFPEHNGLLVKLGMN